MATPFDGFGAEARADGGKARAVRPRAGGGLRVLWLIIGLVVAGAASVYLYERVAVYRARERIKELNVRSVKLIEKSMKQSLTAAEQDELIGLEWEDRWIRDRHPELRPYHPR